MDAQIDLEPVFAGVTAKNFKASKPNIVTRLKTALQGKLAQDANLDDISQLLDALDPVEPSEGTDAGALDPSAAPPTNQSTAAVPVAIPGGEQRPSTDADPLEKIKGFLAGKISPEDLSKLDELFSAQAAADEGGPEGETDEEKAARLAAMGKDSGRRGRRIGKDAEPAMEPKDMITKGAMDEAIKAAIVKTQDDAAALRAAERKVRPRVGELMGMDSAEAVFRHALKVVGVDAAKVPTEGLEALWDALPAKTVKAAPIAMDAASAKSFADRHPDAARVRVI